MLGNVLFPVNLWTGAGVVVSQKYFGIYKKTDTTHNLTFHTLVYIVTSHLYKINNSFLKCCSYLLNVFLDIVAFYFHGKWGFIDYMVYIFAFSDFDLGIYIFSFLDLGAMCEDDCTRGTNGIPGLQLGTWNCRRE